MHHRIVIPSVVTGIVAVGLLAGCSSSGTATPSATATRTVTATPSATGPSSSASSTGSGLAPSSGGSSSGGSSAGGSGSPARCATSALVGGIEAGSGGAAGSTYVHLTLQNTGTQPCTLQGWPGVSFVGDTNGTQIGNAATEDRASAHPTVTLAAGQKAVAPLKLTNAENYPSGKCDPVSPDGFRVYPPGSKQSLFVKDGNYTACRSTDVTVLNVQALVAEGQAAD